jgi:hypothetical protein
VAEAIVTPRKGTWGEVAVGGYVQAPGGEVWKVNAERAGWLQLVNAQGATKSFPRPSPAVLVTLLEPTHAEAVAALRDGLGAEVVATKSDAEQVWTAAPFPTGKRGGGMDAARMHIEMLHKVYVGDVKDIAGMIRCHEASHAEPFSNVIPHVHK